MSRTEHQMKHFEKWPGGYGPASKEALYPALLAAQEEVEQWLSGLFPDPEELSLMVSLLAEFQKMINPLMTSQLLQLAPHSRLRAMKSGGAAFLFYMSAVCATAERQGLFEQQ
jgi:hypothetical protein